MKNPNWKKPSLTTARQTETPPTFIHTPATEAELEALRYRGTPLHPSTSPVELPSAAIARHPGLNQLSTLGGHNDRIQAINEAVHSTSAWVAPLRQEIARVVVGQRLLVDRLLVGLVTNGHILLEGVPGLAKTLSLKTLAAATQLKFHRLQFTPDMLPADIVGTMIYNPRDGGFHTKHGPIFSNFILADEINRAPAKVQSALLEAMQERQVTLGDDTYALPRPFLVMATQNPLEQEGTYPLPEAQVDRFMLKVLVDYPGRAEERAILDTMATSEPNLSVAPVVSAEDILAARQVVNSIHVDDKIRDYIVDVVLATRDPKRYGIDLNGYVRYGASPRATLALTMAARAWAFLNGRGYVTPQDVKSFALDVLRHRVAVSYEAEAENISSEDIVAKVHRDTARALNERFTARTTHTHEDQPMNPDQAREILKKVRQVEIRTHRLVNDSLAGQYHSVFKGRGMDFDEVREYVPGDEVRAIDWNVTARAGSAFIKKFTEERELTILLMVDVSASGNFGSGTQSKRQMAAELASVLAFSAIRNSDKAGLLLFSDRVEQYIPPARGRQHALRVIREILFFEPQSRGTDIVRALDFANQVTNRRAILFLVSDFELSDQDRALDGVRRAIRLANRRHDVVALHIHDPRESEMPDVGQLAIEDAETGEIVELDTTNARLRDRFAQLAQDRVHRLRRALASEGVDILNLNTGEAYEPALRTFFKNRERRMR